MAGFDASFFHLVFDGDFLISVPIGEGREGPPFPINLSRHSRVYDFESVRFFCSFILPPEKKK